MQEQKQATSSMKREKAATGEQAQERETGFIERPRTASAFFREGTVDGWRRALTPDQAARIVASHGAVMRRLGYDVTLAPIGVERGAA